MGLVFFIKISMELLIFGFFVLVVCGALISFWDYLELKEKELFPKSGLFDLLKEKITPARLIRYLPSGLQQKVRGFILRCCCEDAHNKMIQVFGGNPVLITESEKRQKALRKKIATKRDICKCGCKKENIKYFLHEYQLPPTFQCSICGQLYLCSCQREAHSIMKLLLKNYNNMGSLLGDYHLICNNALFLDNICHLCTKEIPKETGYLYSGKFSQLYGGYIDLTAIIMFQGYPLCNRELTSEENKKRSDEYSTITRSAENIIRKHLDYPLIGEKWINETLLYKIIVMLFSEYTVLREYSPKWLERLRIDIYVQELNLAIEYQGKQHFEPVKHFGGEKAFKKTQERDKLKKKLCKENSVDLIYFNHDENLTEELVTSRLEGYLSNNLSSLAQQNPSLTK